MTAYLTDFDAITGRLDAGFDIETPELATLLRRSRRWLRDFLRGTDYGRMKGRRRVFFKADVERINRALPSINPTPKSHRRARRTMPAAPGSVLAEALALVAATPRTASRNHRRRGSL